MVLPCARAQTPLLYARTLVRVGSQHRIRSITTAVQHSDSRRRDHMWRLLRSTPQPRSAIFPPTRSMLKGRRIAEKEVELTVTNERQRVQYMLQPVLRRQSVQDTLVASDPSLPRRCVQDTLALDFCVGPYCVHSRPSRETTASRRTPKAAEVSRGGGISAATQ